MARLFEVHNKDKFELYGFSFGPNTQDAMRNRVSCAFDQFIDISNKSNREVAQRSRELGIDIAIDLKGYTRDSRPGLFAERCAPIQVNYLGYPGSMAAEYIDYIIADTTVIPKAQQANFTEKVVYLPHSYQVNDDKREISARIYSRLEMNLPETGFVFCCFNNNYKILPDTFSSWMRILQAVNGSVLWLLADDPTAEQNLRNEAEKRGIRGNRILFGKKLPLAEHLARHKLADLFLDTFPYNAHTTASDALWAGLPVLTRMGDSFASRVAGSLLTAIGLPELITHTAEDYAALAIELALNPEKLAQIKAKLAANRLTTPLFDTALFAQHLEQAYETMVARYQADLPPATFSIQPIIDEAPQKEPPQAEAKRLLQLGVLAYQAKQLEQAVGLISQSITLNPHDGPAYATLGNALLRLNKAEAALDNYDKALALNPKDVAVYSNRGIALKRLNRDADALINYNQALALKPDYAEAYFNKGNTLVALSRHDEALACYDKALSLKADYIDVYRNRGNTLVWLNKYEAALANYDTALTQHPNCAEIHYMRGTTLQELKRFDEAIANFKSTLALKPDYDFLPGTLLLAQMVQCDWQDFTENLSGFQAAIRRNERVTMPFAAIALLDSASILKQAAKTFADSCFIHKLPKPSLKKAKGEKIRIAYYSADFHNHATTYLMAGLFERHDKTQFEWYGFSFGPNIQDAMRGRLAAAFDHFFEVSRQSDRDVARLSRELGIDIAVDLKGYTRGARPGIFAQQCAPIQVNYLGYPGTMATEQMDYIIADRTVIPEANITAYSEKIVYLPHSYQVNDSERPISDRIFSRQEAGLPEYGFVFCCFNKNYKIQPDTFTGWMRILHAVKGSVLWLFEANSTAAHNLQIEAEKRGIDRKRLVFARMMPLPEHLARHRLADLFLDTFPCNAHTTASDALWAGLPILTRMGDSFASRVAGSLLRAIDLPELITETQKDYEALAIELALNPEKLAQIKQKLAAHRLTTPLFNTALFARQLEQAYLAMIEKGSSDENISIF